ncbi:hypothetical protein PFICI_05474 [Pestalotiopsis fici W106-1]|uniref:Major facilitator superfamily (MFS) profile domain-containing protein n=1 Tax=Pestalotiopsis fici (strain W106-1 / CGMCC3.15140) TaxID=1229662 RepID=W3XBY7_PESFW|nr:uncharacterized protein PFICI_05474 [Pestalotiopsis fici W106-1]ETS83598.1 hypothetical protein PFICI_05474 [Pestalotiopsis fici W106-1]
MSAVPESEEATLGPFLSNPRQAWIVLFGSFCIIWSTYGMLASNGVFLEIWAADQLSIYPQDQLTWINAVHVFITLFLGGLAGIIFDRYGLRALMSLGSILYLAGFFLLAQCREYWHFMMCYGVAAGIGCALLSTVAMAIIPHWFTRRSGLANGVMMMGGSTGGVMFPQIIRILYENLGWSSCIRILSSILAVLIAIGNICIRARTTKRIKVEIDFRAFIGPKVAYVLLGIALFDFVLFGALGLLPTYSAYLGYGTSTGYNIVTAMNASSGVGRLVSGLFADKAGPFNVMIMIMIFSLCSAVAFWIPPLQNVYVLYIFAVAFGFGTGSVLSLEPTCIGRLCEVRQIGQFVGMSYVPVSFVTLFSVPIGGKVLTSFGATGFAAFFTAILFLSTLSFIVARLAILGYQWKWLVKV